MELLISIVIIVAVAAICRDIILWWNGAKKREQQLNDIKLLLQVLIKEIRGDYERDSDEKEKNKS